MSSLWRGRIDPPGTADTCRWHQVIRPIEVDGSQKGGIALLGLACDEGVRRNGGRVGAHEGPDALRRALSNLPVLHTHALYDAGDVSCKGDALEVAQQAYAQRARQLLDAGHFVIGLGGGHEIGFASYLALAAHLGGADKRIGIFNFDAHFDLREAARASSGTPFLQAINHAQSREMRLTYHCIGASRTGNTPHLFATAERCGVRYIVEEELCPWNWIAQAELIRGWCDEVDAIYVTICLDVLSQSVAPGVSAPNAGGMALEVLEALLDSIMATGRTVIMDVAELCPVLDRDNATARVAARLIHRAVSRL
ncbi:formiminoglutamase [Pseudoxanthomonas indica]|uniref:Formimidoylglutamase n=1 Tax=Pseudoxanthomonas indica TaxID=428993 RepID=A0A1T5IJQ9_9GAMM|nr:formiminoglutamase [Pseudoxanthomonas indica]